MESDVIVIGGGMIGAACAYYCVLAGLTVTLIERGSIGAGTTSACEGNILVSDKPPGAELDLALTSTRLWHEVADHIGSERIEFHQKGGVVVATSDPVVAGLAALTAGQRGAGVDAVDLDAAQVRELEPNIGPSILGGAHYPQDCQVQPMLAAAHLVRHARERGARVLTGTVVTALLRDGDGRVTGVRTDSPIAPEIRSRWTVNAAGTRAGELAASFGAPIPIQPRRGFVLITTPLPRVVRHKVYSAEYVANVAAASAALQTSVVVEGTSAGTVLIGASRERVGFDSTVSLPVIRRLAAQAIEVFPFLADVTLLRSYLGFRPYCPDHLPVIGADPRLPGLIHAAGHEGAGIGLAPATGLFVSQLASEVAPTFDITAFRPDRFSEEVLL
jgi:glycine/D-amino acid oxidase-like deaminating enzyme